MGKLVFDIIIDKRPTEVSLRIPSLETGIKTLRHYGLELITAAELAEAHMRKGAADQLCMDDVVVAEAPVYYPNTGDIVWVARERNPYLQAGHEQASREGYVEKNLAAELYRIAKRDLDEACASGAFLMPREERKSMHLQIEDWRYDEFTSFLFRQHAEAYSQWLQEHGVNHVLIWLMPPQYDLRQSQAYARTLSICGLNGDMASLVAVDRDVREKTMYGVRRTTSTPVT